jgi:glycosyltransferase involved in cell wall biosynthesis
MVIGVVAQLIPRKGHALFFECLPEILSRYPDVHLLCFGRGPLKKSLLRRLAHLNLATRVKLVGFRADLPDLLPGLDLVVHPAEREGLGVAVLEAMSSGVPVVSSTAGGLVDLIEDGLHGLTFEPDDRQGLSAAVARMLSDPELRGRFGVAGRMRAEAEFSVDRMSQRYLEIYDWVLRAAS